MPYRKALQDAARRSGCNEADDGAGGHQRRTLPDHQCQDVAALRAKRHPDRDLTASLRHRVAEQAVDVNGVHDIIVRWASGGVLGSSLPEVLEAATEDAAAQGDDGVGPGDGPAHAGALVWNDPPVNP